jgi:hypothetical protein
LIELQIYWRYTPPALLKSSIDFVIQLKAYQAKKPAVVVIPSLIPVIDFLVTNSNINLSN